ncbi:MAG: hypothetical protein Hals2KO_37220 [Halioglobus sp.]
MVTRIDGVPLIRIAIEIRAAIFGISFVKKQAVAPNRALVVLRQTQHFQILKSQRDWQVTVAVIEFKEAYICGSKLDSPSG